MCQVNLQNGLWCRRQRLTLCSPSVKTSGPLTADLYPMALLLCLMPWARLSSVVGQPSTQFCRLERSHKSTSQFLSLPACLRKCFSLLSGRKSSLLISGSLLDLRGKCMGTLTSSCVHSQESLRWAGSLSSSLPGSLSWRTLASYLCHSEAEPPENMTDRLLSQLAALCSSVDIKFITKHTALSCEPTMNSSQSPSLLPSSCLPMAISSWKHLRAIIG